MPYQVSMMGWVGSGEDFCGLGLVQKFWVGFWKSDPWPTLVSLCLLFFTDRLPWQPAGIKFTQCVSGQKSAFSPLQEKLYVGSKN